MFTFPILVFKRNIAFKTYFSIGERPKGEFFLSLRLAESIEDPGTMLDFFLNIGITFFPSIVNIQVDWPNEEIKELAHHFGFKKHIVINGDSWQVPLFFAFSLVDSGNTWPPDVYASGAIRNCKGLRCVAVAGDRYKLRYVQKIGGLCLLPKSNITKLRREGLDDTGSVELPSNVKSCLDIWSKYV
jgi:hypothetical protein